MISSLLLTAFIADADAAIVRQRLCFYYDTDFVDADSSVGDDFVTSNALYPAKHARARVVSTSGGGTIHDAYLPTTGCIQLNMDDNHTHTVALYSDAKVPSGPRIRAVTDRVYVNDHIVQTTGYVPTGVGTTVVIADASNTAQKWANVMMAATHAITRHTSGWITNSGDYLFYVEDTDTDDDCGSGGDTCLQYYDKNGIFLSNPGVQIDPVHNDWESIRRKYILVHELAHGLDFKQNCDGSPIGCDATFTMKINYNANQDGCGPSWNPSHAYNSKEFQSAAAVEGWAHFVAAFAFNNPTHSDCRMEPNGYIWWNNDTNGNGVTNFSDLGESNAPFSCEGNENGVADIGGAEHTVPPTPVDARDYYTDFCFATGHGITNSNRGTELDWLRFWWDVVSNGHGIDFQDAAEVYQDAESYNWCAGSNFGTCTFSDKPERRVELAFSAAGYGSVYATEDNNGVTR